MTTVAGYKTLRQYGSTSVETKNASRELTSVPLAGIDVTVNGPVNTEVPVYGCAMTTTYRCAGKAKTIVPGDVELGGMTVSVTGSSML